MADRNASAPPPALGRRCKRSVTERFYKERMPLVRLRLVHAADSDRPRTRGECVDGARPCPWVGCRQHLYLDVTRAGNLQLNFPDLEPDEMGESCALDLADRGENSLEDIGAAMGVTRERARQIETQALTSLALDGAARLLRGDR